MGEICRRVRVAGIEAVDPDAELEYRKKVMMFLNSTLGKLEKKMNPRN